MDQENYYLELGLTGDPFADNDDNKNIYLTPQINRRLKQIREHISGNKGLLLVSSLPGAGKSLLAGKLPVLKAPDWQVSIIQANENLDVKRFASRVLLDLTGALVADEGKSVSLLHKHLDTSFKEQKKPVIIVDDADRLNMEMLQFLLQLADLKYNEAQFRVVLFANDAINEQLSKPGLAELSSGNVTSIFMPALSHEQVIAYLKFRVSPHGEWDQLQFEDSTIDYIYRASGGLPGGINFLAREKLQQAQAPVSQKRDYGRSLALFSLFVIALASYIFYEDFQQKDLEGGQRVNETVIAEQDSSFPGLSASRDSLSLRLSGRLLNSSMEQTPEEE